MSFAPSVPDGYLDPVDRPDYYALLEGTLDEVLAELPADTNMAVAAQAVCDSLRLPWEHEMTFDRYAINVRLWPVAPGKRQARAWWHKLYPWRWRYEPFCWLGMPQQYNSFVYVFEDHAPNGSGREGHGPFGYEGLGMSHSVSWR